MKSLRRKKISTLLALTMVISTFIGVTPATTWATQPTVLFEDMFQNPLTTSSALSINKGTWDKEWTLKANPTNSEKNALFYNRVDTEGYILTGEQDWSNYVVETKVYMPTGDSWINLRGYVQEDASKYYQIGYNPSAQTIRLEVVTASGTTTLESYSKQLRANQWYVFKIAFNDGTINCYLDGEKIISVVDTTYTSGKTGLRSNWGSMYVSEYSVKGIPENNEALSCIAKAASSITLDWSDIAGATSYTLYRAENNDNDYNEVYSGTASNYEDTSVTQGIPYYYKMTYTNEEESQYSSSLRVILSDTSYAIRLDEAAYTLNIGQTHATKVTRENEDTSTVDVTSEATYSSLDESVATVNAEGVVTAVALGNTKIKITYDGKDYEVNVTVANDRVVHYAFDEGTGTEASSSAGSFGNAILKNGAEWLPKGGVALDGKDDYIELPQNVLNGLDNVTIVTHVYIDAGSQQPFWIFNFGSSTDSISDSNANYLGFLQGGGGNYRVASTKTSWTGENNTYADSTIPRGVWQTIAYTQEGKVGKIYVDGVKIGENEALAYLASDIINTMNFIGRGPYLGDNYFKGKVQDFAVYNRVLTASELEKLSEDNKALSFQKDVDGLSLGDISAITADIELPTQGASGSTIIWESSNPAVIGTDGKVTRPASNMEDAEVILTATITASGQTATKTFTVTVKKASNSVEIVALDKEAITLYNLEDLRGNMTLPTIGENGSTISWACSPALITPTGEVTRPSYGEGDKTVTLTATITHEAVSTTREFSATVRELPKQEDLDGYLFTYFIGDGKGQEQMSFALSEGNTPLKWNTMNEGNPVLIAELGEKGLRDPSIIRSPEGDKFYLIATDLQIAAGKGWGAAQKDGSKCIFVWESTDLVNWSKQRLVQVSSDLAGCTWAPEIIYDEDKGEYVVYWASKIYVDESKSGNPHHRIMYATTRDFYTFSPAKEYFNPGYAVIDTVMIKNNGKVYRFTKDERDNGTGSGQSQEGKMIFQEVGSSIFANDFRRTANDFVKTGVKWVEGPLTFKDNLEEKWYLFVDDFGGEGYIPFYTDNLDTGTWTKVAVSDKKMPSPKPRHGTILPITASEYARLQTHVPVEAPVSIELVTGVSLPTTLSTQLGQITSLQATVTPASAANKEVTFESSDPTVVTVKDGELSCLALGKAIITAKTKDGGYTAACTVTVNEATNVPVPVTNVTLNETQLEVKVGKERQLVATVVPDHATLKAVKWESSDPSIATVDENGKVTAVALGSALITATSINGNKTAICNISVVAQGNGVLYNFDENAGAIAKDSLENKEDAQLKGGVSWTEGLVNGAAKLDGNNGYIALPDDVIKGLSEMTIQMWVNQQEDKRWSRILDFGNGAGDNLFLSGYGSPGGGKNAIGLHLVVGDTEDTVYSADNFRLTNNEWTHLAVTFKGTTCTIYMNGEEIAKNTGMRVNPSGLKNSMNYIGKSKYGADPYFKGSIDEFSVQDKALTGAEIKEGIKQYLNEPETVTIQSLQDQVSISTQVGQAPILPAQVEATYSDGSKVMVNVRWNSIAASQYAQVGTFRVEGTIEGTNLLALAEIVVNEKPIILPTINNLKSIQVTTVVGTAPELPAQVEATYNDGSKAMVNVRWNSIVASQYAQVGTFRVEGTIEGTNLLALAEIVVNEKPIILPTINNLKSIQVTTVVGTAPELPAQVEATYSDGSKAMVNVKWDSIAVSQYAQVGKFTVEGTVADTTLRATVEVVVNAATSGGSGSGSSPNSTISVSKAEQAINKLSEIAKEEVKRHIQSVKEKIPYTSLNTAMTVQQLDELTKGKFKKEELEEMLKKPELLEKLGIAKDLLPKVVVLEPIKDARFIDVNATHWANNYIKQAAEMGLVAGNPDGSFAPKSSLTQGDTFTFLDRVLLNKGIIEMKLPRTVVEKHVTNKKSWSFPYVASIGSKLSEATLVETCAYTEKGLTRELLAQVLYELTNGKLEVVRTPIAFQDVENSPYKEAIDYCTSVDLLFGTSKTTMEPHRALTRAEMMTVIIKLNELLPVQK